MAYNQQVIGSSPVAPTGRCRERGRTAPDDPKTAARAAGTRTGAGQRSGREGAALAGCALDVRPSPLHPGVCPRRPTPTHQLSSAPEPGTYGLVRYACRKGRFCPTQTRRVSYDTVVGSFRGGWRSGDLA
jgi:hypothetical protein